MRDPKRIKPVLEKLQVYWENNPDLRLGQIISNFSRMAGYSADSFYVEDDIMDEVITNVLNNFTK